MATARSIIATVGESTTPQVTRIAVGAANRLENLVDVSLNGISNANILIYDADAEVWRANTGLTNLTLETATISTANLGDLQITDNEISGGSNFSNTIILNPSPASNAGTVIIKGDLTVQGNTVTVHSEEMSVQDPVIQLGGIAGSALPTADDGINRGIVFSYFNVEANTGQYGFFGFDDETQRFIFMPNASMGEDGNWTGGSGDVIFNDLYAQGEIKSYSGTTPANGEILIGGSGGFVSTTLTQGSDISITNANGSITIAAALTDQAVRDAVAEASAVATSNSGVGATGPAANNDSVTGIATFASEQFSVDSGHAFITALDGGSY